MRYSGNMGFTRIETFGGLNLTSPDGENFFIAPRPFYLAAYSDGDINDGTVETVAIDWANIGMDSIVDRAP